MIILLGAGISLDSGAPSATLLNSLVLRKEVYTKHPYVEISNLLDVENSEIDSDVLTFIELVYDTLTIYNKFKYHLYNNYKQQQYNYDYVVGENTFVSYEDIYFVCNQIVNEQKYLYYNPLTVISINQLCEKLSNKLKRKIDFYYIENLADRACKYIGDAVHLALVGLLSPKKLGLLLEISKNKNYKSINIVTLNHDILVENLFRSNKIKYFDGFKDIKLDLKDYHSDSFRIFDPMKYSLSKQKIKLLKLHGSIDWKIGVYWKKVNSNWYRYYITHSDRFFTRYEDENNLLFSPIERKSFLTGSLNKLSDYHFNFYKELYFQFQNLLNKNNLVLVSGYGWNDIGVNESIRDWMLSNPNNRIILLHKNPEKAIRENPRCQLSRFFNQYVNSKRIICIEKWLSEVKLVSIEKYFNSV